MVMLHTGKVLMYSGSFDVSYVERVWDPATGTITLVPNPFYNLFCGGQAQLPDGRILVAGGHDSSSLGAKNANIFDPVTLSWSALPNMAYRRWYPTVTALPDGRMLVSSGGQTCLSCLADVPEIFDPTTGKFSQLTTARLGIWYYPFMFVLPNGRVLSAGSNEQAYETRTLDLSHGCLVDGGPGHQGWPQRGDVSAWKDSQDGHGGRQRNIWKCGKDRVRARHDAAFSRVAADRVDEVRARVSEFNDAARRQRSHYRRRNSAGRLRRDEGRSDGRAVVSVDGDLARRSRARHSPGSITPRRCCCPTRACSSLAAATTDRR